MSVLFRRALPAVAALSACLLLFAAACSDSQADRAVFEDPDGRYSLRYPADWYADSSGAGGAFYSFEPTVTGPVVAFPPDEVKVEAHVFETTGRGFCGAALQLDASGAVISIDDEATETTLGGQPAWEIVRDAPDPPLTRIHAISLLREGSCINLVAYFSQETPDEQTFQEIVDSFEIKF